jgi:SNF2 family DNA or RNA helicase
MLDLIEVALRANGFVYQRIDGQTALSRRITALHTFNTDPNCTVMLASIGSMGEGYVE